MTSSISWGLLEHNYGDLQFIHICCCNEFFCTSFSCSNLCDLLPWSGSTANSQEWLMKDHIKIVFGAAEHSSNHTQNPPPHLYCTFSRCSLLDKCHYYFTETHHTSVTVNELLLYESYCELKNSIKYIESDRCHMSHLPITTTNETMNPLQCDSGWSFNCCNYFGNIGQWYRESSFWDTTSVLYIFLKGSFYIIFGLIWARSNTVKWWLALLAKIHHLAGTFLCGIWVFSHVSACILLRYSGFLLQSVTYS